MVRQGVRIGVGSYSLKQLEPLYMPRRDASITDAASSIVEYERWLESGDAQILAYLEAYNDDDCRSTMLLRGWLEDRRAEAEARSGAPLERPSAVDGEASESVAEEASRTGELIEALTAGLEEGGTTEARARRLLAALLGWHRREDKPEWWRYFRRVHDLTEEDLYEDTEAIAGLTYDGEVGREKSSTVHRYRFDPSQEHKLTVGTRAVDPARERARSAGGPHGPGPGSITGIDPIGGSVDLKRGNTSDAAHPSALIPASPIETSRHKEALCDLAEEVVADGTLEGGRYGAVRDLLAGPAPRLGGLADGARLRRDGEDPVEAAKRLAAALDAGVLAVQGPPGSGKSVLAAEVIVALATARRRVAVTANSHAVIAELLDKVAAVATEAGAALRILQKAGDGQGASHPGVRVTNDNGRVEQAVAGGDVDVVGGTTWLWTRPAMRQTVDYLVVDEAGQLSLANAAAAGTCAENLILVGDPQQLAQPLKGSHPPGAEASALEHLLDGAATIPDDRGLFLDRTWRLHPEICRFVSELAYDGRLQPAAGNASRRIADGPVVGGAGLRWVPVGHAGNRVSSIEEARVVAAHVEALHGRMWTDRDGGQRRLDLDDILVVAPYNAQVALLASELPAGARVGTVDKFQGQQAPAVIVSLAASSAEDAPRGMEFLYSRNRLNVAVSRAQALAVVVASPALLDAHCRTVEQLRLLNGLCRYRELAS